MGGAVPKPQRVHAGASNLARQQPETPPPAIDATPPGGKREIGDLRIPGEIARVIDEALPEGSQLGVDSINLCAPLSIQFNRIVKGTQYVALLYFDAGYPELAEQSWFLASVCLHIFTATSVLNFDKPAIEIIVARSGLLPEDWRDELDTCKQAHIARSTRIQRIESWLAVGPENALPKVRMWMRDMELKRDDSPTDLVDSFGQTAKLRSSDNRATPTSCAPREPAISRKRPLVFISYSHDDKELFQKLKVALAPLNKEFEKQSGGEPVVWTDEDIKTSKEWFDSIGEAMASARVVVALATPSFFYSDFIKKEELRKMLEARVQQQKGLAWILGRACAYDVYGLGKFQAACSIDKDLKELESEGGLDRQLEIARKNIAELLTAILAAESTVVDYT